MLECCLLNPEPNNAGATSINALLNWFEVKRLCSPRIQFALSKVDEICKRDDAVYRV